MSEVEILEWPALDAVQASKFRRTHGPAAVSLRKIRRAMELTLRQMVVERARMNPGAKALMAPGREPLDFEGLALLVEATARRLRELGVRRGDRVALVLPNGPEAATAFLSSAACATAAPLNPGYRKPEFDFYLSDLSAVAVVVSSGEVESDSPAVQAARERGVAVFELFVPSDAPAGVFELRGEPIAEPAGGGDQELPGPDDTALVLHTSGTTSRPKVVPLSQRNLAASARNIRTTLRLEPGDRCLNVMPLFHIHGLLGVFLSSLQAGASVVATPGFDARRFFDWIEAHDPTWYSAVPTMHQAVLARAGEHADLIHGGNLRLIRSSSAALAPSVLAELEDVFGVPVVEAYGMTEAAHQMACNPLPPATRKPGSVGPAAGPDVRVIDDQWRPLSAGGVGEVAIRGENVTAGYEANPEANEAAFEGGWFRTGDEGYLDEDGYLFLTGRLKEIINRGGEKIAPREIDEVLLQHSDVDQAVAFAMPDAKLGEVVAAAIVLREGATAEKRDLLEFAAGRLADFKLPREVVFLDAIPKGPTGKLQRIGLAERLGLTGDETGAGVDAEEARVAETDTERLLVEIFSDILETPGSDAGSDFFASGGDSLLAGLLIQRLAEATGVTVPIYELFDHSSVARLAALVDSAGSDTPATGPLPDAGDGPHELSFAQAGLWIQERLAGGTPINNRLDALRILGPLDVPMLERAITDVFRRHEVLRARFPVEERKPKQVVEASVSMAIPLRDLRGRERPSQEADIQERAMALAAEPFDLASGPIQRLELLSLSETEHILLCVMHHIAFDGWSMSVLTDQLARSYAGLLEGHDGDQSAASVRYADYAAWLAERNAAGAWAEPIEYWRARLANPPPELELPGTDAGNDGDALEASEGARTDIVLSAETHARLIELGRGEGTTLFMTLLAAFDAFLHRWSGAEDLVVGTLVAGRSHPASQKAVGLFANTLVLRTDLSGDPSFRELLARVREVSLGAYANAEVPFEVLVREFKPPMTLGRNPYFDAVFQLRNLPETRAAAGGVRFEGVEVAPGFARFALLVEAFVEEGRLHTRFEVRRRRFGKELMAHCTTAWQSLLESVAADPDVRLSALPAVPGR